MERARAASAATLDRLAEQLEETGWAAALLDSECTLAWVSSQLRLFMAGAQDDELGVGRHCEALQTSAWRSSITQEARERWLRDNGPYIAHDTPGGAQRLRELVSREDRALLDDLEPSAPPPLWGWTIQFLQVRRAHAGSKRRRWREPAPGRGMCEIAGDYGADVIVVGSKGMQRRVLGSVPNTVSHRAPCSVLIVRTD